MQRRRIGNLYRHEESRIMKLVCRACGLEQSVDTRAHNWPYDAFVDDIVSQLHCTGCQRRNLVIRQE